MKNQFGVPSALQLQTRTHLSKFANLLPNPKNNKKN